MSNLNKELHMPSAHDINNLDIFNTLAVSKYLKKSKFTEAQAEALGNVLKKNQDAMISYQDMEDRLATKSDIADVKSEIQEVRSKIQDVRSELKDEIQELRSELKGDVNRLEVSIADLRVSTIKWQVGTTLILASLFISLIKF